MSRGFDFCFLFKKGNESRSKQPTTAEKKKTSSLPYSESPFQGEKERRIKNNAVDSDNSRNDSRIAFYSSKRNPFLQALWTHTLIFEFIEVHFSLYLVLSAYFSSLLLTVLFMIIFDSRAFALRKETWFDVYQNQSRVTSS